MKVKKDTKHSSGRGILNKIIDKLPFEIHLPGGYQWCGPGTRVSERLALGQTGINKLDSLCQIHDLIYATAGADRKKADRELEWNAWELVKNSKLPLKERVAAWAVVQAMKLKGAVGGSVKVPAGGVTKHRRRASRKGGEKSKVKKKGTRVLLSKNRKTKKSRTRPIRKGGILPLLMAALPFLSTIGSLAGGGAAVAKTIFDAQKAREQLNEERERRNRRRGDGGAGSSVSTTSGGKGMFVQPYRRNQLSGGGLFVRPYRRPTNGGAGVKIAKGKGKSKN